MSAPEARVAPCASVHGSLQPSPSSSPRSAARCPASRPPRRSASGSRRTAPTARSTATTRPPSSPTRSRTCRPTPTSTPTAATSIRRAELGGGGVVLAAAARPRAAAARATGGGGSTGGGTTGGGVAGGDADATAPAPDPLAAATEAQRAAFAKAVQAGNAPVAARRPPDPPRRARRHEDQRRRRPADAAAGDPGPPDPRRPRGRRLRHPTALSTVAAPPDAPILSGRATRERRAFRRPPGETVFGILLAIGLAAVGLRAGGGLLLAPTAKVEIWLDVVGGLCAAIAVLAVRDQRWWGGVTIAWFAALALLTALSITWSIVPSDSWLEANRTIAYLMIFAAAVVGARAVGAWWSAVLGALCAASTAICAYAILTKVFPGALAAADLYARLREPYQYWNAVGLTAAIGVPPTLWLGARRSGHAALNALAYPIMGLLLLTVLLAYSRGSLLAMAIGVAFWFAGRAAAPARRRGPRLRRGRRGAGRAVGVLAGHADQGQGVGRAARDVRARARDRGPGDVVGVARGRAADRLQRRAAVGVGGHAQVRGRGDPRVRRAGPGRAGDRAGDVVQGPGRVDLVGLEVADRPQRQDHRVERPVAADVGRQRARALLGRVDQGLQVAPAQGRRRGRLPDRAAAAADRQPRRAPLARLRGPDRGRPRVVGAVGRARC